MVRKPAQAEFERYEVRNFCKPQSRYTREWEFYKTGGDDEIFSVTQLILVFARKISHDEINKC